MGKQKSKQDGQKEKKNLKQSLNPQDFTISNLLQGLRVISCMEVYFPVEVQCDFFFFARDHST